MKPAYVRPGDLVHVYTGFSAPVISVVIASGHAWLRLFRGVEKYRRDVNRVIVTFAGPVSFDIALWPEQVRE